MNAPAPFLPVDVPFARALWQSLLHDYLFWILLLVLAGFTLADPGAVTDYPSLVDWPTMATLAGLLMLTKGVELSGLLHRVGVQLIGRIGSQRGLALFLVLATAALATLLTNDVALFVVVPLTLTLGAAVGSGSDAPAALAGRDVRAAVTAARSDADAMRLPITRLIIFEALAANAGSALTPIGNPQNLYLWQQSHQSFAAFTLAMLPLALLLVLPLLLLTAIAFSGRPLPAAPAATHSPIERPMLLLCLALYPPFLLMTDRGHAPAALTAVLTILLVAHRRILAQVDWGLLLVFLLMFIDLRLAGAAAPVRALFTHADLAQPQHLYLAAIAASQVISNVPATILLNQYSHDWRVLAYGVNVGGAGLAIGSLANIIALRMATERRAWLLFHAYSVPFLLLTGAAMGAWLRLS